MQTLADSLGDWYAEKEYLVALVDLGQAALIARTRTTASAVDADRLRIEFLDVISSQQCVPSSHLNRYTA